MNNLSVAHTDQQGVVLLTLEVEVPLEAVQYIKNKIGQIVEVHQVLVYKASEVQLQKMAYLTLSLDIMSSERWPLVQQHGAVVTKIMNDCLVVQKVGNNAGLEAFFQQMDGPHLISFYKSGLIVPESLIPLDTIYADAGAA
jgi:acetolactate synthase-1/3 small subunit